MDKAVKPDELELDFDDLKLQIFDYNESLVATLQSENECKLKLKINYLLEQKIPQYSKIQSMVNQLNWLSNLIVEKSITKRNDFRDLEQ